MCAWQAVDCTVLPILLMLLPVAGSSVWLHKAAHLVSLYFVMQVGGAAVAANLAQHRKPLLGLWGLCGLLLISLANVHLPHGIISHALEVRAPTRSIDEPRVIARTTDPCTTHQNASQNPWNRLGARQCVGATQEALHKRHEMINVFGCALLLSSQWASHRALHAMGKDCGHNHGGAASCGHSHDH